GDCGAGRLGLHDRDFQGVPESGVQAGGEGEGACGLAQGHRAVKWRSGFRLVNDKNMGAVKGGRIPERNPPWRASKSVGKYQRLTGGRMFGTINDFTADHFTPPGWEDAEEKVRFPRRFIRFVESDFAERDFPQALYRRLALTFGHIAHYNRRG